MRCPTCDKVLSAPESAVGKKAKCPACGTLMVVPETTEQPAVDEIQDAEEIGSPAVGRGSPDPAHGFAPWSPSDLETSGPRSGSVGDRPQLAPGAEGAAPVRRPCPMCGEMIVATAAKCRFCGAIFDRSLRGTHHTGMPTTSGAAIASLVLGILSPLFCYLGFVPGIAAIVFGAVARNQISKSPNLPGRGLATAGLILGILGSAFWILADIAAIVFIMNAPHAPPRHF